VRPTFFAIAAAVVSEAYAQSPPSRAPGGGEFTTERIGMLKPGEFIWRPEISPSGPVVLVVSIPDQRVYVYRNGLGIGVSTVSTGKPGHETPTGVFTILENK
jgi:L,D-transpeptidase catalytic domain